MPRPVGLRTGERSLVIEWDDGLVVSLPWQVLRDACPCATCNQKRAEPAADLPVLELVETLPIAVTRVDPVGNYAYGLSFSDGHNTGIYTIDFLRLLCEAAPSGNQSGTRGHSRP